MRHFGMTTAALLVALAPGAAVASVIPESFPINIVGSGLYEGSIDVPIGQFDSSLGTLKHETLVLSGTFTPGWQWPATSDLPPGQTYPASVPVLLTGNIGIFPGASPVTLATETVRAIASGHQPTGAPALYVAVGTPEKFRVKDTLPSIDFDTSPITIEAWTEPSNYSQVPAGGPGDPADLTQVQATLTATYTYKPAHPDHWPVPEPASLTLLASGLLGLGVALRRHSLGKVRRIMRNWFCGL